VSTSEAEIRDPVWNAALTVCADVWREGILLSFASFEPGSFTLGGLY